MPLAWFRFFFPLPPLYFGTREYLILRESSVIYVWGYWRRLERRARDGSSPRIFLSLPDNRNWFERPQGRKTFSIFADCNETCEGQRFFALFRAWFRRDTPSLGNGPPLIGRFFYSLPRDYLILVPKPFKDSPYPQSTSAAQFTFASFLFPLSILSFIYFIPSCSDQNTGVNLILCTWKILKIIFNFISNMSTMRNRFIINRLFYIIFILFNYLKYISNFIALYCIINISALFSLFLHMINNFYLNNKYIFIFLSDC